MSIRRPSRPFSAALLAAAGLALPALTVVSATPAAAAGSGTAEAAGSVAPGPWVEDDMTRAIQLATSQGKYLLIDFTGSDWCGWCIRLDEEVFDQRQFIDAATKDFVFAKLDFPRRTPQSDAIKRHNRAWQTRLGVRGFPTIFLADAQGRPFARTGYRRGGPGPYLEHLNELVGLRRQQERLIEQAMRVEGLDRARSLGQALAVPTIMTPQKDELLELIRTADPEDSLGLVARYGKGADAAEKKKDAEEQKTPFEKDLEAIAAMIKAGDTDEAASGLRRVQQRYRPEGAQLADWAVVRMDFLAALGRHTVAAKQADRIMRTRGVPDEARQRLGRHKAEILLAGGKGAMALEAWDAAIRIADSELAAAMKKERDAFAARCRAAGD